MYVISFCNTYMNHELLGIIFTLVHCIEILFTGFTFGTQGNVVSETESSSACRFNSYSYYLLWNKCFKQLDYLNQISNQKYHIRNPCVPGVRFLRKAHKGKIPQATSDPRETWYRLKYTQSAHLWVPYPNSIF